MILVVIILKHHHSLYSHAASADHQKAIIAPKEGSNLSTSVNRVCNKEESVITVALKTVYFLAQEGIALSKYTNSNMMKFLKKVGTPNLDSLNVNKRADYSSYNTAVDLLTALSDVIDEIFFFLKLHESPVLTILTDESTDFIVHHKLCISACVVYMPC
jgi:adenylate cyclase